MGRWLIGVCALLASNGCAKDPEQEPKPVASNYGFLPEVPAEEKGPAPPPVVPMPSTLPTSKDIAPEDLLGDEKALQKARTELKAKVAAGTATEADTRVLRAVCRKLGDKSCLNAGLEEPSDGGDVRVKLTQMKNSLKQKVASGQGTDSDKRLLRALCRQLGDMSCIN